MVVTLWLILFIIGVIWVTYPDDFPTLIRNPGLLLNAISVETKRRWMIAKFSTILWYERQTLKVSLWRSRAIIKEARLKQQRKEPND